MSKLQKLIDGLDQERTQLKKEILDTEERLRYLNQSKKDLGELYKKACDTNLDDVKRTEKFYHKQKVDSDQNMNQGHITYSLKDIEESELDYFTCKRLGMEFQDEQLTISQADIVNKKIAQYTADLTSKIAYLKTSIKIKSNDNFFKAYRDLLQNTKDLEASDPKGEATVLSQR